MPGIEIVACAIVGFVLAGIHLYRHPRRFAPWGRRIWLVAALPAASSTIGGAAIRQVVGSGVFANVVALTVAAVSAATSLVLMTHVEARLRLRRAERRRRSFHELQRAGKS